MNLNLGVTLTTIKPVLIMVLDKLVIAVVIRVRFMSPHYLLPLRAQVLTLELIQVSVFFKHYTVFPGLQLQLQLSF